MKFSSGQPYHLHGIRVLLFGVLLAALFIVRMDTSSLRPVAASSQPTSAVLGYATNVNRTDLLNATNTYRAQNGLAPLAINSALNTSSQNKAQHMITHNYWAHVAPDGTQPWYFFDQAGYQYQTAGENLAYGFMTSSAIVDAWMNSASHRANILGNYAEVGFGYANGSNYQNGENTVVVAHYGTQQNAPAPAPAPTPAPAAPTSPSPTPQSTPSPASPSTLTAEQSVVEESSPGAPADEPQESAAASPQSESDSGVETSIPAQEKQLVAPFSTSLPKNINVFDGLKLGTAPAVAIASIAMTVSAAAGFALTHRSLVRHAVANGEKFIVGHPMFDIAVVVAISILILTTTISRI